MNLKTISPRYVDDEDAYQDNYALNKDNLTSLVNTEDDDARPNFRR
jgi:hypothetical protein